MPTIDLTDAELAAVAAAIRHAVEEDRFPRASTSALANLEPAVAALSRPRAAKSAKPAPQQP